MQPRLGLCALGAVAQIDVLHLMAEHRCKRVFASHQGEQAPPHEDVSSGKSEGVSETWIRNVVKGPWQPATGVGRCLAPDDLEVSPDALVLGVPLRKSLSAIDAERRARTLSEFIPKGDLFGIGPSVEPHRHKRYGVLSLSSRSE